MKVCGVVLFTLGIIFGILLFLERLGGAHISRTTILIVVLLIGNGWNLKKRAGGLGQQSRLPVPAAPAVAVKVPSTIKLSLSAAQYGLLVEALKRTRRVMGAITLGGMSFLLLLGISVDAAGSSSATKTLPYLAALSVAWGLITGGIWLFIGERPLRQDLNESILLRTLGPIQLTPMIGGFLLTLADRSLLVNERQLAPVLRNLTWAAVDYSMHSHMVFEVRDRSGRSLYRRSGYGLSRDAKHVA